MGKKQKDVILHGLALKTAVRLSENAATQKLVKANLSKELGLERLWARDLSNENVGSAITPSRIPFSTDVS